MEAPAVLADTVLSGGIYLCNDFVVMILELIEGDVTLAMP